MALKITKTVNFKRDNNTLVFPAAIVKEGATKTEVDALINAEISAKLAQSQAGTQELADAQTAYNS